MQVGLPGREECSIPDPFPPNLCLEWVMSNTLRTHWCGLTCLPQSVLTSTVVQGSPHQSNAAEAGAAGSVFRAECLLPLHCHGRLLVGSSCLHAAGTACSACSCRLRLRRTRTAPSPSWSRLLRQAPWQVRPRAHPLPGTPALFRMRFMMRPLLLGDLTCGRHLFRGVKNYFRAVASTVLGPVHCPDLSRPAHLHCCVCQLGAQ